MASIEFRNITSTSFQARAYDLRTFSGAGHYVVWYLDGDQWDSEDLAVDDTTSSWVTFDGLDSDTEYEVRVDNVISGLGTGETTTNYITTEEQDSSSAYEPDMSGVYIQKRTPDDPTTEIAVRVRGLDEDYTESDWQLDWYIHDPSLSGTTLIDGMADTVDAGDDRSATVTFSGLTPGKEYNVELRIRYYVDGSRKTDWFDLSVYTDETEYDLSGATVLVSSTSSTKITVYIGGLDSNYGSNDRWIEWYIDGNYDGWSNLGAQVSSSDTYTFSGLTAGVQYEIYAIVYFTNNGSQDSKTLGRIVVETENPRPAYFEWDKKKVKGQAFNITADEWCRLLDNINEVLAYKGKSKMSTTTVPDATARFYYPSKGEAFLAAMYNQCIYAFERLGLLDYDDCRVVSGQIITADLINFLRDTINDVD